MTASGERPTAPKQRVMSSKEKGDTTQRYRFVRQLGAAASKLLRCGGRPAIQTPRA